ncbi:MAG: hypothetical protein IT310_14890 [Anaerolineales bacterium]|nr:hypothetical protein [Anaerolineales bacterium]
MAAFSDLRHTLNQWTYRLRIQRAFTWGFRGLILGLALALTLGLFGLFQLNLLKAEFLTLTLALIICAPLITSLGAYLWPVSPLLAARHFDRVFHLGERISTAYELHQNHSSNPMTVRQLEDALQAARRIKPQKQIPLQIKKRELSYLAILALVLGLVWFRGERWFESARKARAVEQAVTAQAAEIEQMLQQIQANPNLSEAQKEALTQVLEQAQQSLQTDPSLEGSVAALTSTSEQLQALTSPQAQQMSQALQQTGGDLANQNGTPLQGVGEALSQGNPIQAATELSNLDLSQMDAGEASQLAAQLEQMANALQATNPQLAQELQNAADALKRGDIAAAQQALQNASKLMAQAGQQIAMSQTASQTAQQLTQGAGQIVAAGGGQQSAQTAGQPGNGQNNQSGQTPGGSGAGNGSSDAQGQSGNEADNNPINQNNGAGSANEETYEQIYAPNLLGGEDGNVVNLPGSGQEGDMIGQGPTDPSQPGESLVPYTEAYAQYDQFNREAIESGEIPVDFLSVIRNYFDSLHP